MAALTVEECQRAADLYKEHGSIRAASRASNIPYATLNLHVHRAAERGYLGTKPVLPGFRLSKTTAVTDKDGNLVREFIQQRPELGESFVQPEGHSIKGVSALLDGATGRVIQQWVKTRNEYAPEEVAEIIKSAFKDFKPAKPIKRPAAVKKDLLTLIPCNDWHVNLLTWEKETGTNWDLKIAERVIGDGIEDAIARSPASGTAIILGGGDLTHSDNNQNRTARSANVLDCDGRHQKGLEIACRLMVRTGDAALRRHDKIIIRILPGNHDEHTAVAVAYFLSAYYRNEPRVTVDLDASLFFYHRFGSVLIGATHGHTVKLKDMASIMAHRRAEDWGATKFRYVHGFHIHHASKFVTEGAGVIMESHQAPIPQDAWHFGSGYLSGRSLQTISYHRKYGEISRVRVAIMDA